MKIACQFNEGGDPSQLAELRETLDLPEFDGSEANDYSHLLIIDAQGLSLQRLHPKAGEESSKACRIDFSSPELQYRKNTFGKQQGIAKAVGLNRHEPMHVLDATAGLGRDAFILSSLGCRLTLLEQAPLIYYMLRDGLQRAEIDKSDEIRAICDRMDLFNSSAEDWFSQIRQGTRPRPDVIYLDPMFPVRNKNAAVKRDISLLQEILPLTETVDSLIDGAMQCQVKRVVVKRPGAKPVKNSHRASFIVPGKSAYFEVYV